MKGKHSLAYLSISIFLCSLLPYLEWGGNNQAHIYELELDVIRKLISSPTEALHPFTILPLIGQLFILISIFINKRKLILLKTGVVLILLLIAFIFSIGIMNLNLKMIAFSTPYILLSIVILKSRTGN